MMAPAAIDWGGEGLRLSVLFVLALLFAAVEIEIEGPDGWAEKLPTWYRVRPWYARLFGRMMSGKPLTGYHAIMFFIPLVSFHLGFAFGQPWSPSAEARVVASYLVWNVVWDVLWFLLNPHYGWARFRRGEIWWHNRAWIGRLPIDYYNAAAASILIAALPALAGDRAALMGHLVFVAGMVTLTACANAFAPAYMRWHRHMRRPGADERPLVFGHDDRPN